MKKIFVQQTYDSITVSTLDGEYSEHSRMYDAMQKVFNLKDNSSIIIMDVDGLMYEVVCEEWELNKNFYKHMYDVINNDEIKEMRKIHLPLNEYWKSRNFNKIPLLIKK